MSGSDFTITVDDRVLRQMMRRTPERVGAFLDSEAEQMVNGIRNSMGVSPSEPFEPPGVDTGILRASYEWEPDGNDTRIIYTDVEYAVWLEFGVEENNLDPRPHVGPEVERTRARLGRDAANFGLVK